MSMYRHPETCGRRDEITVIEDCQMFVEDAAGLPRPIFNFIDPFTIKAHPLIIQELLIDCERVWTLDEVLGATD